MARKGQETESVALDDLTGLPSALSLARSFARSLALVALDDLTGLPSAFLYAVVCML